MIKILHISLIVLILLSGCVTQTGPGTVKKNFDLEKAAKNRVSLGLTYLKSGNFSSAKFNLDKALEFAPRSADANFAIAYYYQKVGELVLAEKSYKYAMDLEPKNADIANSYGAFLCQNGSYEKAKTYFLKAVNTSNYISSAQTYENLALCSQNQGRDAEAIQYYRSAVNHQPSRVSSLYLLTQSLIGAQEWAEANVFFKRYQNITNISAQSLLIAYRIEQGLENHEAATGYSSMLLKLYPNDPLTQSFFGTKSSDEGIKNKVVKREIVVTSSSNEPIKVNRNSRETEGELELTVNENSTSADEQKITPKLHYVKRGENLYRISLQYNIKMETLIEWNKLANESAIYNGMKLFLVEPGPVE